MTLNTLLNNFQRYLETELHKSSRQCGEFRATATEFFAFVKEQKDGPLFSSLKSPDVLDKFLQDKYGLIKTLPTKREHVEEFQRYLNTKVGSSLDLFAIRIRDFRSIALIAILIGIFTISALFFTNAQGVDWLMSRLGNSETSVNLPIDESQIAIAIRSPSSVINPEESIDLTAEVLPNQAGLQYSWAVNAGSVEPLDNLNKRIRFTAPSSLGTATIDLTVYDSQNNSIGQTSYPILIDDRTVLLDADFSFFSPQSKGCRSWTVDGSGNYRIRVECNNQSAETYMNQTFSDFEIVSTVQKTGGNNEAWYGLIVSFRRGTTTQIDHRFMISGIGTYTYEGASHDGTGVQAGLEIIVPHTVSPYVNRRDSFNTLRLIREGSHALFYANGELLVDIKDAFDEAEMAEIGMIVINQNDATEFIEATFQNFRVFEPEL